MSERRVAVVTGAARGIGAATVAKLVADGYEVAAMDVCSGGDQAGPADLEAVVTAGEGRVAGLVCDVADADAMAAALAEVRGRFGRIDAAVGCAAVLSGGRPIWEVDPGQLDTLWRVDVLGLWHLARETVPIMLRQADPGGCRYVAVASAGADRGLFSLGAYTMVKHAVVGLVRALAADLVGTGVTAVAVSPGATNTQMLARTAEVYGLAVPELLAEHQLLRRLLAPQEIAEVIAFCCAPGGAVLNGSVVAAGGGFTG